MMSSTKLLSTVVARDFSQDGIPDLLIVWDSLLSKVGVDGEGALHPFENWPDIDLPSAFCLIDVGKGLLDVVVSTSSGAISASGVWRISIAPNGGFSAPKLLLPLSGVTPPPALVSGDVNGDGRPDIVFAGGAPGAAFQWFELARGAAPPHTNDTSAQVAPHVHPLPAGGKALNTLVLADVDGDGALDVVAGVYLGGLQWYRNEDGRGTFGEPRAITDQNVIAPAWELAVADFNGDGRVDIACAPYAGPSEALLLSTDGRGAFHLHVTMEPVAANATWYVSGWAALVPVDLDGDGDLDLVTTRGGAALTWIENLDGRGSLTLHSPLTPSTGLQGISLVDIDNDGDFDIVCVSPLTKSIELFRNVNPTFVYAHPSPPPLHTFAGDRVDDLVAAELLRDDHLDVVAATGGSGAALWLLARTDARWQVHNQSDSSLYTPYHLLDLSGQGVTRVAVGDIDGDDRLDVVVSARGRVSGTGASVPMMYVLQNRSPLSSGGAAAPAMRVPEPAFELIASFPCNLTDPDQAHGDLPVPLLLLDIARHGRSDLITLTPDRVAVQRFRNLLNPNGTAPSAAAIFEASIRYDSGVDNGVIVDLVAADLNGDGYPDIVLAVAFADEGHLRWCLYDPEHDEFDPECNFVCAVPNIGSISVGDLDGDGDVDLVVLSADRGTVGWCENYFSTDEAFPFKPLVTFGTDLRQPLRVITGDLDADHDLDVAVLHADNSVVWFENRGNDLRPLVLLRRALFGARESSRETLEQHDAPREAFVVRGVAIPLLPPLLLVDVTEDGVIDVLRTSDTDAQLLIEVNQLSPPPLVLRVLGELAGDTRPRANDSACWADPKLPCRTLDGAVAAASRWRRGATTLRLESPSDDEEAFITVNAPTNIDDIWRTWREMLVIEVAGGTRGFGVTLVSNISGLAPALAYTGTLNVARNLLRVRNDKAPTRAVMIRGAPLTLRDATTVTVAPMDSFSLLYVSNAVLHLSGRASHACGSLGQWSCTCHGPVVRARTRQRTRIAPVRFSGSVINAIQINAASRVFLYDLDFSAFRGGGPLPSMTVDPTALVSLADSSELTATRIRFADNDMRGAALSLDASKATIATASFERNRGLTALLLASASEITFTEDAEFVENHALTSAGGAIFVADAGSSVSFFTDATFRGNTARTSGGAVYLLSGSLHASGTLTLDSNVAGTVGGGVHIDLGQLVLNKVVAKGNAAGEAGGAIRCNGFARASLGVLRLERGLFYNNLAGGQGGAVASTGCAIVSLSDATFDSNRAGLAMPMASTDLTLRDPRAGGGALYSDGDHAIGLDGTVWRRNMALRGTNGGAIWLALANDAPPEGYMLPGTLVAEGNTAVGGGGGVAFSYVSSSGAWMQYSNISGPVLRAAAAYGPIAATQFVTTRLVASTVTEVAQTSRVPLVGQLAVELLDAYDQVTASDSSVVLRVSAVDDGYSPIGPIALAASNGVVNWTGTQLALDGRPGTQVRLLITIVGDPAADASALVSGSRAHRRMVRSEGRQISLTIPLRRCQPGEQLTPDERACVFCAAGSFSNETNARTCTPCPLGTHAPAVGASACAACGTREFTSHIGSVDCLTCGSFHYARMHTNSTVGCEPCPAHVDCVQHDEVLALPGYWVNRDSDGFVAVMPCGANRCVGSGQCARGRLPPSDNVLCGMCREGYVEWSGECVSCENESVVRAVGVALAILVGSLALAYGYHLLTVRARSSSRLKVLVFFVQAALVVLGTASSSSRIILSLISLDPLRLLGASCLITLSQFQRLMLGFSAPALALGLLAVVMLLVRWRGGALSPFGASAVAMLVLTFIPMVHTALEFFRCVEVQVGDHTQFVVFAYPEVNCESTAWRVSAVFVATTLFLWVMVFPLTASRALLLHRRRRRARLARMPDADGEVSMVVDERASWRGGPRAASSALAYAEVFLAGGYRDAVFFYEFVALGRRVALLAVNVVLATAENQNLRLIASALCLMASAALHAILQPFRHDEENRAEAFSLAALCVLPLVTLAVHLPLEGSSGVAVLIVFVVLPAVLLLVWVLRGFFEQQRRAPGKAESARALELADVDSASGLRDPLLESDGASMM